MNETCNSISITDPGNYAVTITVNQGCFSTQTILATAIEIDFKTGFEVFPNPYCEILTITGISIGEFHFSIYSADGKMM